MSVIIKFFLHGVYPFQLRSVHAFYLSLFIIFYYIIDINKFRQNFFDQCLWRVLNAGQNQFALPEIASTDFVTAWNAGFMAGLLQCFFDLWVKTV